MGARGWGTCCIGCPVPRSSFLSTGHKALLVFWSPFLIQCRPQAALSIFPFRGLIPSCKGVPLRGGVGAWDADWAAPGEGGGRPGQARAPASQQVILAPDWSLSWENCPSFLDPSAPRDRKLRPGNTASCFLRAVAAPAALTPFRAPSEVPSGLLFLCRLPHASPLPPGTPSRPSHRLCPSLFSYLRPSHVSSRPRHPCSGLGPALPQI